MALPLMLMAASAAAQVASKVSDAHAQEAQQDANARIADQNRAISTEQGYAREDAVRRTGAQSLGRSAAVVAQSGIDPNSGSAADSIRQAATNVELDAQTVRYQGLMQGFGFQRQAGFDQAASDNIASGVPWGAASTALGAANSYYNMTRPTTQSPSFGGFGGF